MLIAAGWWTTDHVLALTNVVVAAAAAGTAIVAVVSIRSSGEIVTAAKDQAKATKETVDAATKQLELGESQLEKEREALQLAIRPILVDVQTNQLGPGPMPARIAEGEDGLLFVAQSRNVGPGAAFIHNVSAFSQAGNLVGRTFSRHVVPPGETLDMTVGVDALSQRINAEPYASLVISFIIHYTDVGGGQKTETVIEFSRRPGELYFSVTRVELRGCNEDWIPGESIVRTGPA